MHTSAWRRMSRGYECFLQKTIPCESHSSFPHSTHLVALSSFFTRITIGLERLELLLNDFSVFLKKKLKNKITSRPHEITMLTFFNVNPPHNTTIPPDKISLLINSHHCLHDGCSLTSCSLACEVCRKESLFLNFCGEKNCHQPPFPT